MRYRSSKFSVVLTNPGVATLMCASNPHRRCVMLGNDSASGIFYNFGTKPTSGVGIQIVTSAAPVQFRYEDLGDCVTWDIWAWNGSASAINIGMLEAFER